jgi:phenylalanyl-tRNA synthetase alpha chain
MKDNLEKIKGFAAEQLCAAETMRDVEEIKVKYLGKKGELTAVLRGMGGLSPQERPVIGELANKVRQFIENEIDIKKEQISKKEKEKKLETEKLDVTLPGRKNCLGRRHPLKQVLNEVSDIFIGMGFDIAEGPDIESDYYNFEALNIPKNHPARDTQDTFYISENMLLRTQTSPVQIHVMENQKPPIKIIAPGMVYRSDAVDATHSPVFNQIEGLVVGRGVTMGDLKGTLEVFLKKLYGESVKVRFRPHHFPFTEPSAEVDISCFVCGGEGCRVCKDEGWIEILGAGMVHPKVLANCGIDPEVYSGYAFGVGLERIVMRRYGIDDLRLFFENDIRFLKQF